MPMDNKTQNIAPIKAPRSYDTSLPLPYPVPMDAFYKEKIPLLFVFKQSILTYAAKAKLNSAPTGRSSAGRFMAAECGVYKGHSLIACARIARDLGIPAQFIGLDTFAGLPDLSAADQSLTPEDAPYKNRRLFADAPLSDVRARCESEGVADSIELIEGIFKETLKRLPEQQYDFVNIDCDLYEGHTQCLEYFYPRMRDGGTIFFDDYNSRSFPMARKAVDDFLETRTEQLFHICLGSAEVNHTKAFLIKSASL